MALAGNLLQGLVLGSLTSLTAMGLVLIFRSSGIVNFAQAEMGGLGAAAAVEASVSFGLPYPAAIAIGIAVGIVVGAVIDLTVVRLLGDAPKLMLTVATIGLAEVVGSAEVLLGRLHASRPISSFGVTSGRHWHLGGFLFGYNHLVAVGSVAVCALVLAWFLEGTDRGLAMQAAAESREKAGLLGIRVRSLSLATWSIAGALSAIGAILAQPILGVAIGQTAGQIFAGPTSLLPPLAAAVVGGMRSVKVAFIASMIIGVVEQLLLSVTEQSIFKVDLFLFAVILLWFLVRPQRHAASDELDLAGFEAIQQIRQLASGLRSSVQVRVLEIGGLIAAGALVVGGPLLLSRSNLILTSNMALFAILAISLVVLTGWSGQISLGQFGFGSIGGALSAALLVHLHWNLLLALAAGAAVGALATMVVGLPALRIPGWMFAVTTLAFGVAVSSYFLGGGNLAWIVPSHVSRPELFGKLDLSSQRNFYFFCLGCLLLVAYITRNLRLSRTGRAIMAVRDNPQAAAAYGVKPVAARLTAFGISGAFAGVAGALYFIGLGGVGPATGGPDPELSLIVFTMIAVGGTGSVLGGILGAAYIESVLYFLPGGWQLFASGAGLLLLILVFPTGLGAVAYRLRDMIVGGITEGRGERRVRRKESSLSQAATSLRDVEVAVPDAERERHVRTQGDATIASGGELMGCSNLRAGYNRKEILHAVSLSLNPGEIVGVLGPNGSGKTTLLRVLAGVTRPTSGSVRMLGRRLRRYPTVRRVEQGMVAVLGGRSVFRSLTVEQNLRLGAWLIRDDPDAVDRGIRWALELFPVLGERMDVAAGSLSGGEQQMLALSQAFLCRPRVLLIDEMSLGLAPVVVQQLLGVLRKFADAGVGILLVEQSMSVATALCDRIALLERGVLVFGGRAPDLSARPELMRSVFLRSSQGAAERLQRRAVAPQLPLADRQATLPALSLRSLSKSFGGVTAVDDVNLVIPAGEILGLFGPNGSGKTTLLDLCSGFLSPDRGHVGFFGRDVTRMSPARRALQGIGRIFQNAELFPSLSAQEAVEVALERRVAVRDPLASALRVRDAVLSERRIKELASTALQEVGLLPWSDHRVSELSTGLRRLLEIACVLVHRPRLLMLDEPSAGIAQRERGPLAEVIQGLKESTGATFVIVEHDVPLISLVADRVAFMNLGSVVAVGPPDEVFRDASVVDSYLGARYEGQGALAD